MTFAVYLIYTPETHSCVKFGSYDTTGLHGDNTQLTLLKTTDIQSWSVKVNKAIVSDNNEEAIVWTSKSPTAIFDYSMPFIYIAKPDFESLRDHLRSWFRTSDGQNVIGCNNSQGRCWFSKTCEEVKEENASKDLILHVYLEDRDDPSKQKELTVDIMKFLVEPKFIDLK